MFGLGLRGRGLYFAPETGAGGGAPAQGQEPAEQDDGGQEPTSGQEDNDQLSAEAMEAELRRARREAARYRTQLRELEERQEEQQRAEMTEVERLRADLEAAQVAAREAQAAARQRLLDAAVQRQAVAVGVRPDALQDVARLLDTSDLDVDDESGQVEGLEDALAAFLEARPFYRAQRQQTNMNPTNPSGTPVPETDEQRRARLYGGHGTPRFGTQGGGLIIDGQVVES